MIDHFNGIEQATAHLANVRPEAAISEITRAGVLTGFTNATSQALANRLLDAFQFFPLYRKNAGFAADLRRVHGWKPPDAFQAAVALGNNLKLVTRNTRDFPAHLDFVIVPYQLS